MKQKLAALLAASVVGIGILGGSAITTNASEASVIGSEAEDATVIEHWTFTELFTAFYSDMVDQWNVENPEKQIRINVHVLPYDDMHNKLQIALNSGTGAPDTVDIEISKFANFTEGENIQLADLTPYVESYKDDVLQARLDLFSKDGKLYGAPTHGGVTVCFYNDKLLSDAGIDYKTIKTWDDFKEAGSKYYEATGKCFGNLDTSSNMVFNLLLAQFGGDYVDENGKISVNNEKVVQAMELMKELQDANALSLVPGGAADADEGFAAYNSGDFAVMLLPMWMSNRWINYMPDTAGQIAVAAPPVLEDTACKSVGGGGTGTAVVKTSEVLDAAAEFIAYAKLSAHASEIQWNTLGNDPLNTTTWEDEAFTHNPENQFLQYYVNNPFDDALMPVKDGFVTLAAQTTKYYPSISNQFNTVVLNAVFENGDDIQETLDLVQSDLESEFPD